MEIQSLIIIAIGVAATTVGVLYRRSRARQLDDVTDETFIKRFSAHHSAPTDAALRQRRRIARMLGIPREKLTPEQTMEELSKRFGYLAEFSVAWSDLDDEVRELRRSDRAEEHGEMPSTVGQLIAELARAGASTARVHSGQSSSNFDGNVVR